MAAIALLAAGGAQAALGAVGSRAKRKAERRAAQIKRQQRQLQKKLALESLSEREEDLTRELGPSSDLDDILKSRIGSQTAARIIGNRGLDPSSSPFMEAQDDLAHLRKRRQAAIDRARTGIKSEAEVIDTLERLDIELASSLENLQIIQGFLSGGGIGAIGEAFG